MIFNMCMGAFTSAALLGGGRVLNSASFSPTHGNDGGEIFYCSVNSFRVLLFLSF